jgi:hypothetical protein
MDSFQYRQLLGTCIRIGMGETRDNGDDLSLTALPGVVEGVGTRGVSTHCLLLMGNSKRVVHLDGGR